jgi:hypothetical protein
MSSEDVLETNNFLFRFEPKQTETRFVSVFFAKLKKKNSVCFGVSEPFQNEPKQKIGISKQTATED